MGFLCTSLCNLNGSYPPVLVDWVEDREGEGSTIPEFLEKGLEKELAQILGPAQTNTQSMQF